MGYELRVKRQPPLAYAELAKLTADAGLELRGTQEASEVFARHGDAEHPVAFWQGRLFGRPGSDWEVAQLVRLADLAGAGVAGEDGEVYGLRNGIVEQVNGETGYEFGKLEEILSLGPSRWSA